MFNESTNFKTLHSLVSEGIASGEVRPLSRVTFAPDEFASHHRSRVLLRLADERASLSHRYFVVLSHDGNSGNYTCTQRVKSGLPATVLDLSLLHKKSDADGCSWYCGAAVAFERALQSSEPILLALLEPTPHKSLLQQIAVLNEIYIPSCDEITLSTSLEQLGISKEKSLPVVVLLRDIYNVYFDEEQIPLLTIDRINKIEHRTLDVKFEELKGLDMFYSYVDSDELLATTKFVVLPTLANNFAMREDEFDVNKTHLCIVPGLEGHHERFRALCERLKLSAFVLQPGLDRLQETPQELALRYSKVLLKKTCLKDKFYILGYETGVVVALELAAILEENGITGTVFCLGNGPDEITAVLERVLSSYADEEALQDAIARHMFSLMVCGSDASVECALHGCSSWSERVDACVRALLWRVSHSAQYARAQIEAAYARIGVARRPLPPPRELRSRLVLLRARPDTRMQDTRSLQRYSHRSVDVRDLTAPMEHAAADLEASAIINSCLDTDILQAFEKKNLCDSYLMNTDVFTASLK